MLLLLYERAKNTNSYCHLSWKVLRTQNCVPGYLNKVIILDAERKLCCISQVSSKLLITKIYMCVHVCSHMCVSFYICLCVWVCMCVVCVCGVVCICVHVCVKNINRKKLNNLLITSTFALLF